MRTIDLAQQQLAHWGRAPLAWAREELGLQARDDCRLVDQLREAGADGGNQHLPAELVPSEAWHSWDPTPWNHPWLTTANLEAARNFEQRVMSRIMSRFGGINARMRRFGFVGNLANNMAMRAMPLRKAGYDIGLYLHPQDRYVMSQPGWELYDGTLAPSETSVDQLHARGRSLPVVRDTHVVEPIDSTELVLEARRTSAEDWLMRYGSSGPRQLDVLLWPSYFAYRPLLSALADCDALFAAQAPYLAYLSRRPYLTAQTGGDLWLDCSRNDAFGILQRRSYARSAAILATNPWAYANARRFGFRHVLYVPLLVDTNAYSPGPNAIRDEWQRAIGGSFFALITARIDRRWKGSQIGIEGFARFLARHPGARLVLVGWGENHRRDLDELRARGLEGRYITLPVSGKRRLLEYLRAADCLIDQFVIGYYGATALEAMAAGLPVIMRLARSQYDAVCPTGAPPVLDAADADEVAAQLERLAVGPDERKRRSHAARNWIERNHSVDVWGEHYGSLLNAVASRAALSFVRSPLSAPLTPEEHEYHREALRAAPTFPSYEI